MKAEQKRLDRPDREKIVQDTIDWLKPYLKKGYGVGCYFTDTEVVEWVICDEYGDAIDAPNYTLEPKEEL